MQLQCTQSSNPTSLCCARILHTHAHSLLLFTLRCLPLVSTAFCSSCLMFTWNFELQPQHSPQVLSPFPLLTWSFSLVCSQCSSPSDVRCRVWERLFRAPGLVLKRLCSSPGPLESADSLHDAGQWALWGVPHPASQSQFSLSVRDRSCVRLSPQRSAGFFHAAGEWALRGGTARCVSVWVWVFVRHHCLCVSFCSQLLCEGFHTLRPRPRPATVPCVSPQPELRLRCRFWPFALSQTPNWDTDARLLWSLYCSASPWTETETQVVVSLSQPKLKLRLRRRLSPFHSAGNWTETETQVAVPLTQPVRTTELTTLIQTGRVGGDR